MLISIEATAGPARASASRYRLAKLLPDSASGIRFGHFASPVTAFREDSQCAQRIAKRRFEAALHE